MSTPRTRVTRACNAMIPCHRVLRADGNLAGPRWGMAVKRSLLTSESA